MEIWGPGTPRDFLKIIMGPNLDTLGKYGPWNPGRFFENPGGVQTRIFLLKKKNMISLPLEWGKIGDAWTP